MTLQEAIKELKEYNSFQKKEKILSDRITEAIDTLISAYEITDEEIEKYAFEMYHEVEDSRWFEPLQVGAKAFRDGKISKT